MLRDRRRAQHCFIRRSIHPPHCQMAMLSLPSLLCHCHDEERERGEGEAEVGRGKVAQQMHGEAKQPTAGTAAGVQWRMKVTSPTAHGHVGV